MTTEYRVTVQIEEVAFDSDIGNPIISEEVVYTTSNLDKAELIAKTIQAFGTALEELTNDK